jgi:hypothetical protein
VTLVIPFGLPFRTTIFMAFTVSGNKGLRS